MRAGIDVFPATPKPTPSHDDVATEGTETKMKSLGKSRTAATMAVAETALSRVLNATPIMVLPPLVLARLQRGKWLGHRPRMVLPVNLGLILTTSVFALPLALAVFPQRQVVEGRRLERDFRGEGKVEFNRGI